MRVGASRSHVASQAVREPSLCATAAVATVGSACQCSLCGVSAVATGGSAPPSVTQGWAAIPAKSMRSAADLTNMRDSRSFTGSLAATLDGNRYCNCKQAETVVSQMSLTVLMTTAGLLAPILDERWWCSCADCRVDLSHEHA